MSFLTEIEAESLLELTASHLTSREKLTVFVSLDNDQEFNLTLPVAEWHVIADRLSEAIDEARRDWPRRERALALIRN